MLTTRPGGVRARGENPGGLNVACGSDGQITPPGIEPGNSGMNARYDDHSHSTGVRQLPYPGDIDVVWQNDTNGVPMGGLSQDNSSITFGRKSKVKVDSLP